MVVIINYIALQNNKCLPLCLINLCFVQTFVIQSWPGVQMKGLKCTDQIKKCHLDLELKYISLRKKYLQKSHSSQFSGTN